MECFFHALFERQRAAVCQEPTGQKRMGNRAEISEIFAGLSCLSDLYNGEVNEYISNEMLKAL